LQQFKLDGPNGVEQIWGEVVSGNYFDVLGVTPQRGRTFSPEEDQAPRGSAVAVIGHDFWQRRFNGDPELVGKTITINFEGPQTWIEGAGNQTVVPIDDPPLGGEVAASVAMPIPYMVIQFSSPRQIAELVPPPASLGEVFVWAWEDSGRVAKARFFADEAGVPEDPATGSAAFALAAYFRSIGQPEGRLVIHQGDEIGHPSTIRLRWDPVNSSIGGTVVRDEVRILDI
jgi:hypothetical protein